METVNNEKQKNPGGKPAAKKIWVKKSALSEFLIKTHDTDGVIDGGEITCEWAGKTEKFNDMADIIKFIEEQCDISGYPQSQRKLRGWDNK